MKLSYEALVTVNDHDMELHGRLLPMNLRTAEKRDFQVHSTSRRAADTVDGHKTASKCELLARSEAIQFQQCSRIRRGLKVVMLRRFSGVSCH